jgi:hypothetical protein
MWWQVARMGSATRRITVSPLPPVDCDPPSKRPTRVQMAHTTKTRGRHWMSLGIPANHDWPPQPSLDLTSVLAGNILFTRLVWPPDGAPNI